MYAVIQTGGKQYKVSQGDRIQVERLEGQVGDQVRFEEVLFLSDGGETQVGSPKIEGARVVGKIVDQSKGKKILVFKFKRRKMYRRLRGHRQMLTDVQIEGIESETASAEKTAPAKTSRKKTAGKSRGSDSSEE